MYYQSTYQTDHVDVFVVDRRPQDYGQLLTSSAGSHHAFQFAIGGHDALKLRPTSSRVLWLINTDLEDMTGYALTQLVQARHRDSTIFLVGDQYDPRDEIAARCSGAAFYGCKPADREWLNWIPGRPPKFAAQSAMVA